MTPDTSREVVEEHARRLESCTWRETAELLLALLAERDALDALIGRMHAQDVAAIQMWREANPGNDLTWPDNSRLTAWCMGEVGRLRDECADRIDLLNRLGLVTAELGLPFDATGSRVVEAIRTYSDFERSMGFFDGRDRAVAILMRKAHAGEDEDLTPIEEAIREQLIYAAREIRELKPKDATHA